MHADERPEKRRCCKVRVDRVLQSLPEPQRHKQAIRLCSDALERFSREELVEFKHAIENAPDYWPFLAKRTRAELADIATGQIALLDAGTR
jgi:hypothetical protein